MAKRIAKPRGKKERNGSETSTHAQPTNGTHPTHAERNETNHTTKSSNGSNLRECKSKKTEEIDEVKAREGIQGMNRTPIQIKVRKTRFVDWKPGAVSAIAAAPNQIHLAVAREAGDGKSCRAVEVWETEYWTQVMEIKAPHVEEHPNTRHGNEPDGGGHGEITGLAWVQDGSGKYNTLVTSGLDGMLVVWNLQQKKIVGTLEAGGGAIWDMTCHPARRKNSTGGEVASTEQDGQPSQIACACDDGRVRVFAYTPQGLEFRKVIGRAEGRALSVAWQGDHSALAVGTSDGFIRVYNTQQPLGREAVCISLGDCCVWSLLLLDDGTIVSGDSNGTTSFWDPEFGTLLHEFNQHEGDVLCIAASTSGSSVFSSGIDSKICSFEKVEHEPGSCEWVYTDYKRTHTHDVHSLAIVADSIFDGGAIVSGGNDTQLFAYSADNFSSFHPVRFCRCPQLPNMSIAGTQEDTQGTIITVQRDLCVEVWQIGKKQEKAERSRWPVRLPGREASSSLLCMVDSPARHPIRCSAFCPKSGILAISDTCLTTVTRLDKRNNRLKHKALLGTFPSAFAVFITGDGSKLCLHCTDGSIGVYDIVTAQRDVSLIEHLAESETCRDFSEEVLVSSMNKKWFAITAEGKRRIHVYNAERMEYHGPLPCSWESLAPITALAFDEDGQHLGACTADDLFCLFNVQERKPSPWTTNHGSNISRRLEKVSGLAHRLSFCRTQHALLAMIGTPKSVCVFDLNAPVTDSDKVSKKRKRSTGANDAGDANFKVLALPEPCLHVSLAKETELLIVEKPWLDVLESFPPPLYRHRYGT
uniref:Anaphase-promoting complex subunit 4 WD40 domain-containing protein n=1 Tax=Picocystis salinarum TaxID=88271 RepID=A0A7S3UF98_9CHLO